MTDLHPGVVGWVELGNGEGREQGGRRPCVVVSTRAHLRATATLVTVVPCTTRDRGWVNHVPLDGPTGLDAPTFAITEQVRTISRDRLHAVAGAVDAATLARIRWWLGNWAIVAV